MLSIICSKQYVVESLAKNNKRKNHQHQRGISSGHLVAAASASKIMAA